MIENVLKFLENLQPKFTIAIFTNPLKLVKLAILILIQGMESVDLQPKKLKIVH